MFIEMKKVYEMQITLLFIASVVFTLWLVLVALAWAEFAKAMGQI